MHTGRTTRKKLWTGIALLTLLSPLGLVVPALFGAGGAWGEWGIEEIRRIAGYVPEGMERLAERWRSPLPDYTVPGQGAGIGRESVGYIVTGLVGVAVTAGAGWLLARLLAKRDGRKPERTDQTADGEEQHP